jgi:hypothetical protein
MAEGEALMVAGGSERTDLDESEFGGFLGEGQACPAKNAGTRVGHPPTLQYPHSSFVYSSG